jgi:hypothetical protein
MASTENRSNGTDVASLRAPNAVNESLRLVREMIQDFFGGEALVADSVRTAPSASVSANAIDRCV